MKKVLCILSTVLTIISCNDSEKGTIKVFSEYRVIVYFKYTPPDTLVYNAYKKHLSLYNDGDLMIDGCKYDLLFNNANCRLATGVTHFKYLP